MVDDADITDDEMLALPGENIPAGRLTAFFTRRAEIQQQRALNELALELSGNGRRLMIFPDQDPRQRQRHEEEQERALFAYEQAMREIRERQDCLLAVIEEHERIDRKRLGEIENNALRLHDGRRAYVDGDRYRDEQGRKLTGADHDEAAARHREKPDASTWAARQGIQERLDEHERQRQRVLKEREETERDAKNLSADELDRKRREAEGRITAEEKEFNEKVEKAYADGSSKATADTGAAYSADYGDLGATADAGRTTSFAKTQDGAGNVLAGNFTPAAAGQGRDGKDKNSQPSGPPAPKFDT